MQRMQRRMGKLLPRTADESEVSILLKDFEDVDSMLDRLIAASGAWRDAWREILRRQQGLAAGFDSMYQPVIGTTNDEQYKGPVAAVTPEHISRRTVKLEREYAELDLDMTQEVNEMDLRVVKPAEDAKASVQPLKKVIKKRQDRKLDYERYQSRYDNSVKKIGRSERENTAMHKHESDLARAKEDYALADHKMKQCLPPVLNAVFSLLPYILAAQIMIQNNLLGHCYTQVSTFCEEAGLPVPAPNMETIVGSWEADLLPVKQEIESLNILKRGKTVTLSMGSSGHSNATLRRPSMQSTSSYRDHSPARSDLSSRSQSAAPPAVNLSTKPSSSPVNENNSVTYNNGAVSERPRMLSVPSQSSLALATPNYLSSRNGRMSPENLAAASPAGPKADYFARERLPSVSSNISTVSARSATSPSVLSTSPSSVSHSNLVAAAAQKKRPPPPPKPKHVASMQTTWVTALYDFTGQGQGDLTFREGDRIKVIKRTDSTQDWWEGELAGIRGSFPANYTQVA